MTILNQWTVCKHCGVTVDASHTNCPNCGIALNEEQER